MSDDSDLFDDNFVSKRKRKYNDIDEIEEAVSDNTDDKQSDRWRKNTRKKAAPKKPEAKVKDRIEKHLRERYGARVIRTNAGWIKTPEGDTIFVGETGRADLHACIPIKIGTFTLGLFMAIECKAGTNTATDTQEKYLTSIAERGGIVVVANNVLAVDEAIAAKAAEILRWLRQIKPT